MRKLILHMLISVDGFIADTEGSNHFGSHWDEGLQRFNLDLFNTAGALVYGRGVYEKYVSYWESVAVGQRTANETETEIAFAERLSDMPKFVVSDTLEEVAGNTQILRGDIPARIAELKSRPGGDILLFCGPRLFAQLTASSLIDEYMLYAYPIALSRGVHLFEGVEDRVMLEHLRNEPFAQGVNLQVYRPVAP